MDLPSQTPRLQTVTTAEHYTVANVNEGTTSSVIQVLVRVRPFSKKELGDEGTKKDPYPAVDISSDAKSLTLYDPKTPDVVRGVFVFDHCMSPFKPSRVTLDGTSSPVTDDSDDDEDKAEQSQEECYARAGQPILQASWQGFNGCIFAYGQTSSGKTYTMMGTKRDPGLIPRLCRKLFEHLEEDSEIAQKSASLGKQKTTTVSVSYMEIYNEQVRDLLKHRPKDNQKRYNSRFDQQCIDEYKNLKVRQHPLQGPFVEGITKTEVKSWVELVQLIRSGNELRAQTSTQANDSSSRSHAIFQIMITHTEAMGAKVRGKTVTNHRVSKVNLVDLAGSERLVNSGVSGKHVTEASHINQSLSTLRKVIDALIQNSKVMMKDAPAKKATVVIPYRESLLTWILSDNFGGNSKTVMVATVSPASVSWHETESTLRYATLARSVVNRVRVNEDASTKLIRELQAQLKTLQEEIAHVRIGTQSTQPDEARLAVQAERVRELEEHIDMNHKALEELHQREDILRHEMKEYKNREMQLLTQQEELKKTEEFWRNKAQQAEQESEKLKDELRAVKESVMPVNNNKSVLPSPIELVKGDAGRNDSLLSSTSLRSTKGERKMFWLDDLGPTSAESAKQTEPSQLKSKLATTEVLVTPPQIPTTRTAPPDPEWSASSPRGLSERTDEGSATLTLLKKRRQTQPVVGFSLLLPPPTTTGAEAKHGRRASTGDVRESAGAGSPRFRPQPENALRAVPVNGRRAHSHLIGEDNKQGKSLDTTSAVLSEFKTRVAPLSKLQPGTDALEEFMQQPIVLRQRFTTKSYEK